MNELIEEVVRLPRKQDDPTMVSPWKNNTQMRRELFRLSEFVPVMLKLDAALQDMDVGVWWHCWSWDQQIELTAVDEGQARKIVGKLIFAFGSKPEIKKVADDKLESHWLVDGVAIIVKGYKPSTCHYEEVEVKIPAQRRKVEKKVIPAQKARTEKRRILVCDDVKTEPQIQEEVASVNLTSEVPF